MEAEVLPAIQDVFNKYCDKDGLMTKASLVKMPPFEQMLVRMFRSCYLLFKLCHPREQTRPVGWPMMNKKTL